MNIAIIVATIENADLLETFCDTCEQPIVVPNDIVVKIIRGDGRKFLLAREIPCRYCARKAVLPKTFEDTEDATLEIINTFHIICRTGSLSEIKMLSLIEPQDLREIFS